MKIGDDDCQGGEVQVQGTDDDKEMMYRDDNEKATAADWERPVETRRWACACFG